MTIWERVVSALTSLSVTMAANVLIVASEAERPAEYLVYSVVTSPAEQFADNAETARSWLVQISYYNRAGLATMPYISGAMAAAGFMPSAQRELPYNQQTRHFGYALDFVYAE
ncbi:MAG: hypothetical protein CVU46_03125 [Chloroflexi bacterium HGW-Chloroflexi-8]|nr:MAG: hypothetical protein CVU46_03125 [Chloroflexi bacterium HGW-Chloroflexi-8]